MLATSASRAQAWRYPGLHLPSQRGRAV